MIVLDASVVVELLLNGPLADSLRRELAGHREGFILPHVLDVEVGQRSQKSGGGFAARFASQRATSPENHKHCRPNGIRTRHCSIAFGSCGITSRRTTPPISRSRKR